MQYNAMQCNAMQCNAMQCNAMQCNAMQSNAMQCNVMQCNAMQCNAMQCNTKQNNTIQYNTIFTRKKNKLVRKVDSPPPSHTHTHLNETACYSQTNIAYGKYLFTLDIDGKDPTSKIPSRHFSVITFCEQRKVRS